MASIVSVKKRKDEDFNKMLSRFKRLVKKSDHLTELRNRQEFLKPSVVKRKAKLSVIRQNELEVKKLKLESGDTTIQLFSNKKKKKSNANAK